MTWSVPTAHAGFTRRILDAAFAGLNVGGDWTLTISDNAALNTGALNGG
jgi:subtilisin-like proprotein convertase family protein